MNYSEMLYKTVSKKEWDKVRELLKTLQSADEPDNLSPDHGGRNALYFVLIDGEFSIASRLYELGMRLDCPLQNCTESDSGDNPAAGIQILQFLSHESAYGRNYFFQEKRSLGDCCRMGLFCQAESLLKQASPEELGSALAVLPESFVREKSVERFEKFLDKLLLCGAAAVLKQQDPATFQDQAETYRQIARWPAAIAVDQPERLEIISGKIFHAAEKRTQK